MYDSDFMSKKGVRYFQRGPNKKVKVGFFNYEVIITILGRYPDGLDTKTISDKSGVHYNTTRHTIKLLLEMNRITGVNRKVKSKRGAIITHYQLTPWRIE